MWGSLHRSPKRTARLPMPAISESLDDTPERPSPLSASLSWESMHQPRRPASMRRRCLSDSEAETMSPHSAVLDPTPFDIPGSSCSLSSCSSNDDDDDENDDGFASTIEDPYYNAPDHNTPDSPLRFFPTTCSVSSSSSVSTSSSFPSRWDSGSTLSPVDKAPIPVLRRKDVSLVTLTQDGIKHCRRKTKRVDKQATTSDETRSTRSEIGGAVRTNACEEAF